MDHGETDSEMSAPEVEAPSSEAMIPAPSDS